MLLILHHGGIYNFHLLGVRLLFIREYVGVTLLGLFIFMAGSLCAISAARLNLKDYLLSRLLRIYLPYLIALLLFLWLLSPEVSAADLMAHLLGAQMLLAPKLTTPILTLWFVGLILVYYLIFALLLRGVRGTPGLVLASLGVFALAVGIRAATGFIHHRFFYYFPIFALGVILMHQGRLERIVSWRHLWLIGVTLAALGVGMLAPLKRETGALSFERAAELTVFLSGMILLSLSLANRLAQRGWAAQFFRYVSQASFFAYLFHRPVWELCARLFRPDTREALSALQIATGFVLVVPVCYALQRQFDKLVRRFRPRLARRPLA